MDALREKHWDFSVDSDRQFLEDAIHEALFNIEVGQAPECTALQLKAICVAAQETLIRCRAQDWRRRRNPRAGGEGAS